MKTIFTMVCTVVVLYLGLQTSETVKEQKISVSCPMSEAENSDCLSLGPLGVFKPSGIKFWITSFIHHSTRLPVEIRDGVQNHIRRETTSRG